MFDDNLAIVNNSDTSSSASFMALWSHDIWGKSMLAEDSHHSYRPLLILTFKVLRMVWDTPVFCICSRLRGQLFTHVVSAR